MTDEVFSPTERKILQALGKKKMWIKEISDEVYQRPHLSAQINVATLIRRINQKCDYHRLPWFLNGAGAGRAGRQVWRDKRP